MPAVPLIAVDSRALAGPMDGIARWTVEMVSRLPGLLPARYLLASSRPIPIPPALSGPAFLPWPSPRPWPGTFWLQALLPEALERGGADLLLAPLNVLPFSGRTPAVVVIHDLTTLRTPWRHTAKVRLSLLPFWGSTLRRAAAVVVPSRAVADDLASLDPGLGRRLVLIPNGVDGRFHPSAGPNDPGRQAVRDRISKGRPFILSVGTLEPRKDIGSLVEAMESIWQRQPESPDLVIVGRVGWKSAALLDRIATSRCSSRIHRIGHATDEDLPGIYRAAELLVFPSLDEGFGIPPLEAMASGLPVVARDIPSLREIGGASILRVGVRGVEPLVRGIEQLLGLPAEGQRRARIGIERAALFSWDAAASRLAEVCRAVLEGSLLAGNRS